MRQVSFHGFETLYGQVEGRMTSHPGLDFFTSMLGYEKQRNQQVLSYS